MARSQTTRNRKSTGGRYHNTQPKRLSQLAGRPALTKVGETRKKTERVLAGNTKVKLLESNTMNLVDPSTGKCTKAKVKQVTENPANRNYVRRNILTKGAIVDTDKGKAKVTSRPGQEGTVNGVLVK